MKIDKHTKFKKIAPLITDENLEDVLQQAICKPLAVPVVEMSIAEFASVTSGEYEREIMKQKYAFEVLGQMKQLRKEVADLNRLVERLTPPETIEEKAAKNGVIFPDLPTRMVLDILDRFPAIKSFDEAEQHSVAEWLVIFKARCASENYQRNLMNQRKQ